MVKTASESASAVSGRNTIFYFNNFKSYGRKYDQDLFLQTLYHDAKGGMMLRQSFKGKQIQKPFYTKELEKLRYDNPEKNIYVTVNTFRGKRRASEEVFNRTAMYVDLDSHSCRTAEEFSAVRKQTEEILSRAFDEEQLPVPTMITFTGRGFGLYFVLRYSVPNNKTEQADKINRYFDRTYHAMISRFKEVLAASDQPVMQVDSCVTDAARLCRLPGTVNQKTSTECRLVWLNQSVYGETEYCTLADIAAYCPFPEKKKPLKKLFRRAAFQPGIRFFENRIQRLCFLQQMRGENSFGCRENMCFILYSALVQAMDKDRAVDALYQFNEDFPVPLPEKELEHIVMETDTHVIPEGIYKGQSGFYPYSNQSMVRTLGITEEECEALAIGKSWERKRKAEEKREKKKKREQEIIKMIREFPARTYRKIGEIFKVSGRTVERIAKKYQCGRYLKEKNESDSFQDSGRAIAKPELYLKETAEQEESLKQEETDKKRPESFDVSEEEARENELKKAFRKLGKTGEKLQEKFRLLIRKLAKLENNFLREEMEDFIGMRLHVYSLTSKSEIQSLAETDLAGLKEQLYHDISL